MVLQSPPPHSGNISPIEFIDDTSTTLLELIKDLSEESGSIKQGARPKTFAKEKPSGIVALSNEFKQRALANKHSGGERVYKPLSPPPQFSRAACTSSNVADVPSIKVTTPDSQIVLTASTLMSPKQNRPPKKQAPSAPVEHPRPPPGKQAPIANVDSDDNEPISYVSLNDSTEKLVPRPISPESDCSTLPPTSPRATERTPDLSGGRRKGAWL